MREGPVYARFDLAELLDALVHVRDWSRAEEILGEAIDLAAALGPCRTAALLRETATRTDRSSGAPSTVIDAADRIRYLVDNASQHRLLRLRGRDEAAEAAGDRTARRARAAAALLAPFRDVPAVRDFLQKISVCGPAEAE